jgi:hypothetical protein
MNVKRSNYIYYDGDCYLLSPNLSSVLLFDLIAGQEICIVVKEPILFVKNYVIPDTCIINE